MKNHSDLKMLLALEKNLIRRIAFQKSCSHNRSKIIPNLENHLRIIQRKIDMLTNK